MNFEFDADQFALRDGIRALLDEHWTIPRLRATLMEPGIDGALWAGLVEAGLFQTLVAEDQDGLGLDLLDLALIIEEFGRALVPGLAASTLLATDLVNRFGQPVLVHDIARNLLEEGRSISIASQEPSAGYAIDDISTSAVRDGENWRVTGTKTLVPNADFADTLMLTARTGEGETLVLVCDRLSDGISLLPNIIIDPSSKTWDVTFKDVLVPAGNALASGAVDRLQNLLAFGHALELVGCASRAMAMAVEYATQRHQFGKPIGSFQAIKHKLSDMFVALETARSAAYYAAWAIVEDGFDPAVAVSRAKVLAGEACRQVCNESHQIHGGIGFTWDYDLHFFIKRGKFLEYAGGDAAWHRQRVLVSALQEARLEAVA